MLNNQETVAEQRGPQMGVGGRASSKNLLICLTAFVLSLQGALPQRLRQTYLTRPTSMSVESVETCFSRSSSIISG